MFPQGPWLFLLHMDGVEAMFMSLQVPSPLPDP